jgi:hypothetical protein
MSLLPAQLEPTIDAIAAAVGMPIAPECRPGVLHHFTLMQGIARQFLDFPLPAEVEPAAVFRA